MLTFEQCRAMARACRNTEHWRQVHRFVRPPAWGVLARRRAPLALLLFVAARDGRLVWHSLHEFAVLEPPIGRAPDWASSAAGSTWLGRLDRHWDAAVLAVPSLALLLLAVPVAALTRAYLPALVLVLAGVLIIATHLALGLVAEVVSMLRTGHEPLPRLAETHEGQLRGHHWVIGLLHVGEPEYADRLLRAALARSLDLARRSFVPDAADGTHAVACLDRAVTTEAGRLAVAAAPSSREVEPGGGVFLIFAGDRFDPPQPEAKRPLGFVAVMLFGAAAALAVSSVLVAQQERAACGATCAGRPATWPDALLWLVHRLTHTSSGVNAATFEGQTFGVLIAVLGPVLLLVAVIAAWNHQRYKSKRSRLMYSNLAHSTATDRRILILVALEVERDAVLAAIRDSGVAATPVPDAVADHAVFRLGRLGRQELILAQSEEGSAGVGGATLTAHTLIDTLRPTHVVMSGICYGLRSRALDDGRQELGDILVSSHVVTLEHRKVTDDDGTGVSREVPRGVRVEASNTLLSACRAATASWSGPTVHVGDVLSWNTLIADRLLRADLRRRYEEAAGGEMELAGVYAAATRRRCEWIMVKGISDWGTGGMTPQLRLTAATNAARFLAHVLTSVVIPLPSGSGPGAESQRAAGG